MDTIRFEKIIQIDEEEAGSPGAHWVISDGRHTVRIPVAAAKEFAARLWQEIDINYPPPRVSQWCVTTEGEEAILEFDGADARGICISLRTESI